MSRRIINQPATEVNLEELVNAYTSTKKEADKLKKSADAYNKEIKAEMDKRGISEFIVGDVRATISITPREDFNEQQAIEILRDTLPEIDFEACVKTREYLDDAGLENLIFSGILDATILAPCTTSKEPTVTLRIGKAK